MNHELLTLLRKPPAEISGTEIMKSIAESHAVSDEVMEELTDLDLIRIVNLAASQVARATARMANDPNLDGKIERLYGASVINAGIDEIVNNQPAVLNFTQAVMIVAFALAKGE